jgi:excisionase family DNA binding protein
MSRPDRIGVFAGHEPLLFTVDEVAGILRTSRKAIYAMAERGQLPGLRRVGRRLLVRREELLRWLDHTCAPSPRR